jgi:two-component system cell cycle response regulator CtrA
VNVALAHPQAALGPMLAAAGFQVACVDDGGDLGQILRQGECDVAVIPRDLPDARAEDLLRAWRAARLNTPVMVLDADAAVTAKVSALRAGADDYVVLPCHLDEVAARLRALVRRASGQGSDLLEVGPIQLEIGARRVMVAGRPVHFTPMEFRLLEALMLRPDRVIAREALLGLIRRDALEEPEIKIVDVYVCKVRAKLDAARAGAAQHLVNVWGQGYAVRAEPKRVQGLGVGASGEAVGPPAAQPRASLHAEVADRLLAALAGAHPRDLGIASLEAVAADVSFGTVQRALALLRVRGHVTARKVGRGFRWSATAAGLEAGA